MKNETLESTTTAPAAQAGKYLSFNLDRESYAIPVLKVREIIRLTQITPIPQMPPFIRGVINLRGKIVPVVDLRIRFELPSAQATERTCIVVVHVKLPTGTAVHMGLVVDGVEEVINIAPNEIEAAPDFGLKLEMEFLLGMAKSKGKVTALLDIDRVVAASHLEKINQSVPTP